MRAASRDSLVFRSSISCLHCRQDLPLQRLLLGLQPNPICIVLFHVVLLFQLSTKSDQFINDICKLPLHTSGCQCRHGCQKKSLECKDNTPVCIMRETGINNHLSHRGPGRGPNSGYQKVNAREGHATSVIPTLLQATSTEATAQGVLEHL